MKTFYSIIFAVLVGSLAAAKGASIPAGSVLIVRTLNAVDSVEAPGRPVAVELTHPVAVKGKIVLPAGTCFSGKVISSHFLTRSPDGLTVNLTTVRVAGRDIPVATTGPRSLNTLYPTVHGAQLSLGWDTYPAGRLMRFELARPLVIDA